MLNPGQSEIPVAAVWREFGRYRRKHRKVARRFETFAAIIPGMVLLLHLLTRSAGATPEEPAHAAGRLIGDTQTIAGLQLVAVPEPNVAALVLLGLGGLFYWRHRIKASRRGGGHPSKIAMAVA